MSGHEEFFVRNPVEILWEFRASSGPRRMRSETRPLRLVTKAQLRGGGSILGPFKFHWWDLVLDCGHEVERRCRYRRIDNPPRGFAAMHRGVSLDRLLPAPKKVRCEFCA